MSEQATAPAADAPISAREAAALIAAPVEKKPETSQESAPEAAAPRAQESAPEADAAPAEGQPSGETEGSDDQEQTAPPIDPPRSWTKEDKEAFALLPRETQERLLALDRTREVELRRGQNEAAEQRRVLQAQTQAAEQARQQYEQALPALLQQVSAHFQNEFGQPTWDDVQRWARDEPDKYLRYDAAVKQWQALDQEAKRVQATQFQQMNEARAAYVQEQGKLLAEKAPEYGKPDAAKTEAVLSYLEGMGYGRDEVMAHVRDFVPMTIHDHRFQLILRDAMRFREAEQAIRKAPPRADVPPVQRPGPASTKGEAKHSRLQELGNQFGRSHNVKDAGKLIAALSKAS